MWVQQTKLFTQWLQLHPIRNSKHSFLLDWIQARLSYILLYLLGNADHVPDDVGCLASASIPTYLSHTITYQICSNCLSPSSMLASVCSLFTINDLAFTRLSLMGDIHSLS